MRRLRVRWLTRRAAPRIVRRAGCVLSARARRLGRAVGLVGLAELRRRAPAGRWPRRAGHRRSGPTPPTRRPSRPGPGTRPRSFPTSPGLLAEGYNLYESGCSSCHGIALQGTPGVAPSLIGVGAGPVDFYLSTGRMPLQSPRDEPQRSPPGVQPRRRSTR